MRTLRNLVIMAAVLAVLLYGAYRVYVHPAQATRRVKAGIGRYVRVPVRVEGCEAGRLGGLRIGTLALAPSPRVHSDHLVVFRGLHLPGPLASTGLGAGEAGELSAQRSSVYIEQDAEGRWNFDGPLGDLVRSIQHAPAFRFRVLDEVAVFFRLQREFRQDLVSGPEIPIIRDLCVSFAPDTGWKVRGRPQVSSGGAGIVDLSGEPGVTGWKGRVEVEGMDLARSLGGLQALDPGVFVPGVKGFLEIEGRGGLVDVALDLRPDRPSGRVEVTFALHGTHVRFPRLGLVVRDSVGAVRLAGDGLSISGLRGTIWGSSAEVRGASGTRSDMGSVTAAVDAMDLSGRELELDPGVRRLLRVIGAKGVLAGTLSLRESRDGAPDVTGTLSGKVPRLRPSFRDLDVQVDLTGLGGAQGKILVRSGRFHDLALEDMTFSFRTSPSGASLSDIGASVAGGRLTGQIELSLPDLVEASAPGGIGNLPPRAGPQEVPGVSGRLETKKAPLSLGALLKGLCGSDLGTGGTATGEVTFRGTHEPEGYTFQYDGEAALSAVEIPLLSQLEGLPPFGSFDRGDARFSYGSGGFRLGALSLGGEGLALRAEGGFGRDGHLDLCGIIAFGDDAKRLGAYPIGVGVATIAEKEAPEGLTFFQIAGTAHNPFVAPLAGAEALRKHLGADTGSSSPGGS